MKSITQYNFPSSQYYQTETKKSQIYLHHTAGNADPFAVFDYWASNQDQVATCIVIGGRSSSSKWTDGQIVQGFSSKYWAYHLGLKQEVFTKNKIKYQLLDKISIGIELCNWGQLTLAKDGSFRNYVNIIIPESEVIELAEPFRNYKYYHEYTSEQIESVIQLLQYWNSKLGIPVKYNSDIWSICPRALRGEPGVYAHASVRTDKVDVSPQPKLIEALSSL